MAWIQNVRAAWRFALSSFTRDACERCKQQKLNVMFRWRYAMKLCDQCWISLKTFKIVGADKQRKKQRRGS